MEIIVQTQGIRKREIVRVFFLVRGFIIEPRLFQLSIETKTPDRDLASNTSPQAP